MAKGIVKHGAAYAFWVAHYGTGSLNEFENAYLGHWDKVEDYVETFVDDVLENALELAKVPEIWRGYINFDLEGFARDMELNGDIFTCPAEEGGVHIFSGF